MTQLQSPSMQTNPRATLITLPVELQCRIRDFVDTSSAALALLHTCHQTNLIYRDRLLPLLAKEAGNKNEKALKKASRIARFPLQTIKSFFANADWPWPPRIDISRDPGVQGWDLDFIQSFLKEACYRKRHDLVAEALVSDVSNLNQPATDGAGNVHVFFYNVLIESAIAVDDDAMLRIFNQNFGVDMYGWGRPLRGAPSPSD
ncbi:hypothetical protein BJ508DRAFT_303072 [Ascobolus immersus RN42]|uniref:F-box domain-containing protein n=1 Tax=Ascobolus immersus RN42 TaxID=1160509 RepID=A0A3N4IMJ2_ASCIM|nr:hypothetical protein BJ508DRAFT_303072 [Ascobolus immersus RN42]